MKVKTSITLSEDLLEQVDQLIQERTDQYHNRSAFLEQVAWDYIERVHREQRTARDIEIINERADYLNAETMDALTYQVPL